MYGMSCTISDIRRQSLEQQQQRGTLMAAGKRGVCAWVFSINYYAVYIGRYLLVLCVRRSLYSTGVVSLGYANLENPHVSLGRWCAITPGICPKTCASCERRALCCCCCCDKRSQRLIALSAIPHGGRGYNR